MGKAGIGLVEFHAYAGKAKELTAGCISGISVIKHPDILSVKAAQSIRHHDRLAISKGFSGESCAVLPIVGVQIRHPPIASLGFHVPTGKFYLIHIDVRTETISTGFPDHEWY